MGDQVIHVGRVAAQGPQGERGPQGPAGPKGDPGTNGKFYKIVEGNYSYTYEKWMGYSYNGYTASWSCKDTSHLVVGDWILYTGTITTINNTTINQPIYILAKVTAINGTTNLTMTTYGYLAPELQGPQGKIGPVGYSIVQLETSSSYAYSQWMSWGTPSYTGTWGVKSANGARIGDTALLSGTVSDRENSKGLLFGEITNVSGTSITIHSAGFICQGPKGKDGVIGKDGTPGKDGITPHIGNNGHWYIGNNDTGTNAQGPQGPGGLTTTDATTLEGSTKKNIIDSARKDLVTTNTTQIITGFKTFAAPANIDKKEQPTIWFKTANGGQVGFGKEGPNSGTSIFFDQVAGTRRLNFRASATPGAIVWSQPESNSRLYFDLNSIHFRNCGNIFLSASGFYPGTNNTKNLGLSTNRWDAAYINTIHPNEHIIFDDTSNPYIKMTSSGTPYYFQAASGQFGLGPTWNIATRWDKDGNMTVHGASLAAPVIYENGTSLVNKYLGINNAAAKTKGTLTIKQGSSTYTFNGSEDKEIVVQSGSGTTDAKTLEGHPAKDFILKTGTGYEIADMITGPLVFKDCDGIKVIHGDQTKRIWEILEGDPPYHYNSEHAWTFYEQYNAAGTGNDNQLELIAGNKGGTPVKVWEVKQNGETYWKTKFHATDLHATKLQVTGHITDASHAHYTFPHAQGSIIWYKVLSITLGNWDHYNFTLMVHGRHAGSGTYSVHMASTSGNNPSPMTIFQCSYNGTLVNAEPLHFYYNKTSCTLECWLKTWDYSVTEMDIYGDSNSAIQPILTAGTPPTGWEEKSITYNHLAYEVI